MRQLNLLSVLAFALLIAAHPGFSPTPAAAQQGDAPFHVDAGPYSIDVLANASNLSLGSVTYTITVLNAQDGQPVPDAVVLVRAQQAQGGEEGWANALNSPGVPSQYTARMELGGPGRWEMSVDVSSSLGRVEVEVPAQTVPSPRQSRAGSLVFIGVFLAILMGAGYLVWTIRRAQRKREAADAG